MRIAYFKEDSNYHYKDKKAFRKVVEIISHEENSRFNQLNIVFCSDEYLREINQKYLKRNYYTDIITFPYIDKFISGDLLISIDRIKDNSINFKSDFITELNRVMIHGILHLCGYDDLNENQKSEMRNKEDFYLNFFK